MVALAMLCLGSMNASAQYETGVAPVKMTYVSGSDADVDVAYGECDTIKAGWNLGNDVAVGKTISLGNKGWGANWIGVLKVDASSIPGTVSKATLKAKVSGSLDSKRNTGWGVALTDNQWSADLTYSVVSTWTVSAMLNGGTQVWTTSKSATGFEEHEWDITDAFSSGQTSATILVYEGIKSGNGGAAGGYMTEAVVEVEYEPFEATTTKHDFEDGTNPFTDDSRIAGAIEANDVLGSNVLGWTCANNAQNGYSFAHFDFTSLLNQPALVGLEFDYYNTKGGRAILNIGDALVRSTTGGSSKVTYNSTGVIFQIGSDKNNAFINGITIPQEDVVTEAVLDPETGEETAPASTTYGLCDKWLHVKLMVNNEAKTVAWTVVDLESNVISEGSSAFFAADANECTQIDLFGYINNSHCAMIDNLEITNYKSNAKFADYTIQYVDANNTQIKDSRTGNGQVGKFVKLLDSDKTPFYAADNSKKYIYDSDDSETVAIAEDGSSVISVKFRDAEVYGAVLNCMINGQSGAAARLASFQGDFFEGDNYYVYPSRGYSKDGKYYFTPATSWNGTTFAFPGSLNYRTISGKKTFIGELSYAPTAANEDGFGYVAGEDSVAYYSDIERLALPVVDEGEGTGLGQLVGTVNNWWSFSNGIFDRFSQGRGIRLDEGSYVWTEPIKDAAAYKVTIYGRNDKSAGNKNPYVLGIIKDGSDEVLLYTDLEIKEWGSATTGTNIVENVNIPAGAKLVIMNTNPDGLVSLDDISMTKTGDYIEPVTVGINSVVENAQPVSGIIYNLNGQAVKVATKGLYIKNGKVIVIK